MKRVLAILAIEYADSPGNVTPAAPDDILITVPVALKVWMYWWMGRKVPLRLSS